MEQKDTERSKKGNEHHWYVLQTYSGYEQKVKQALEDRILLENKQALFGDILLPIEEVVEMRKGIKRKSKRKFFPSYILVNMVMNDETWHFVKSLSHVTGFVGGTREHPTPISNKEAEEILKQIETGADKPKPKILFEPGEVIRIKEGPFSDFNGVIKEVDYEKNKLKVEVMIFGRPTPTEIEFDQVTKA